MLIVVKVYSIVTVILRDSAKSDYGYKCSFDFLIYIYDMCRMFCDVSHTYKRGDKSVLTNKKVVVEYHTDSMLENVISKELLFLII